jgi:hypothetical protein
MKEKSRRSRVDALRSQSWLLNCKDGCILGGCRELVFQIMILRCHPINWNKIILGILYL